MSFIQILPMIVQNKISAGEVLERPSAAVKEMVENSLDAGAYRIQIDLEEGGKKLVRIIDNGIGIKPDELKLAITRHATSKIKSADDLFAVQTMGFRGEALASIAAVSHFSITSRQKDADAYRLPVKGGEIGEVEPASCPQGTIIEARNLFFNTPVRLKFMKKDATELAKVSEIVSCIALANPGVGFTLTHNGKEILQLPHGQEIQDRIHDLMPANIADSMVAIEPFEGGFFKISGFLGSPHMVRPRRDHQYLFVNDRVVKDKLLFAAISRAYEGLIPSGKHPVVMLYIDIEPSEVDVNVHPTKFEVRFAHSGSIFSAITSMVSETLKPKPVSSKPINNPVLNQTDQTELLGSNTKGLESQAADLSASALISEMSRQRETYSENSGFSFMDSSKSIEPHEANESLKSFGTLPEADALKSFYDSPPKELSVESVHEEPSMNFKTGSWIDAAEKDLDSELKSKQESNGVDSAKVEDEVALDRLPLIGTEDSIICIDKTYLIANIDNDLYMLDQHAIHERIQYEKIISRLKDGSLGIQQLLVPLTIDMMEADKLILLDNQEELERLGFLIEDFGNNALLINGVPVDAPKLDVEGFLFDLAQNLDFGSSGSMEKARHKLCASMACHSSVRAGDMLTLAEKKELFLYARRNDFLTCPHGRPPVVKFTPQDFAKMFYRT